MKNELGSGYRIYADAKKIESQFGRQFPGVSYSKPALEQWTARRNMMRSPQSGKRNPKSR